MRVNSFELIDAFSELENDYYIVFMQILLASVGFCWFSLVLFGSRKKLVYLVVITFGILV